MAKGQTSAATGAASTLINQANRLMPPVIAGMQGLQGTALQRQGETYQGALTGYQQQQQTGGYDPTQLASLRSELANWAPTGGYDPAQLAQTLGGYGEFAQTGGWTPAMQSQYMQQATSGTPAMMANLQSAAARNAAATGGSAGAAIADIQRTGGEQAARTTNAAQLGLAQNIQQGRLAGLGGLQQTEAGLAGARQGIAGLQTGLEAGVAQGVQGANAGLAGLFDVNTGQVTALGQQILQGLGLQFGTEAQGAQILQELSKNPGLFQTAFGDITQLLSVLPLPQ